MLSTWHLLGAGNMGMLAAWYLQQAGAQPCLVMPGLTTPLERTLIFEATARQQIIKVETIDPAQVMAPIEQLVIATKAGQTREAMIPLAGYLSPSVEIICLQNGMDSLDGIALPAGARVMQAITASGGWRHGDIHHVVAENATLLGDGSDQPPNWFNMLATAWPQLEWRADIALQQLLKLSVNAVINPLTALHDCANGLLAERVDLRDQMTALADEVDAVLGRLREDWPGETMARSLAIAQATAGNTSSMCSDVRAGRPTEIDFINGWLVRRAAELGMDASRNRTLVEAVKALQR